MPEHDVENSNAGRKRKEGSKEGRKKERNDVAGLQLVELQA